MQPCDYWWLSVGGYSFTHPVGSGYFIWSSSPAISGKISLMAFIVAITSPLSDSVFGVLCQQHQVISVSEHNTSCYKLTICLFCFLWKEFYFSLLHAYGYLLWNINIATLIPHTYEGLYKWSQKGQRRQELARVSVNNSWWYQVCQLITQVRHLVDVTTLRCFSRQHQHPGLSRCKQLHFRVRFQNTIEQMCVIASGLSLSYKVLFWI